MAEFIYAGGSLVTKTDLTPIPGSADPTKWFRAEDYTALRAALLDTRTAVLAGRLHGFTGEATRPSVAGSTRFLWVDSDDDKLYYYNGTADVDLTAGGAGGGHTLQNNGTPVADEPILEVDGTLLLFTADTGKTVLSAPGLVPTTRTITAGTGLSGGGDLSANRTLNLANTAVTPNSYTYASITVDAQGRLTAASNGATPALASVTLTAGDGLTGGGDLTTNRSFAVTMPLTLFVEDDNAAAFPLSVLHRDLSGVGYAGLEVGIDFKIEDNASATPQVAAARAVLTDASTGATSAYLTLGAKRAGVMNYPARIYEDGLALSVDNSTFEDPNTWSAPLTIATTATGASVGAVLRNADATVAESDTRRSPGIQFSWKAKLYQEVGSGTLVDRSITVYGESTDTGSTDAALDPALWFAGLGGAVFRVRGGTSAPTGQTTLWYEDSTANTAPDVEIVQRTTSGTAAASMGASRLYTFEDDAGATQDAVRLTAALTAAGAGAEIARYSVYAIDAQASASLTEVARFTPRGAAIWTSASAAASDFALDIDKDITAAANNKLVNLKVDGSQVSYIEADASGNTWISSNGTKQILLAVGGTAACAATTSSFQVLKTLSMSNNLITGCGNVTPSHDSEVIARDFGSSSLNWRSVYTRYIRRASGTVAIELGTTGELGFYGVTPVARPAAYTPTNVTTDRSYDANSTTLEELADVVGTLIGDLQSLGLVQ